MKKWIKWALFAFIALVIFGAIFGKDEPQNATTAQPVQSKAVEDTAQKDATDDARQKALQHFKTEEPKVKDAMWSKGILKLGVLDDGSNRNGFAEYACGVLRDDYKVKMPVIVEVLDIAKLAQTSKEVVLGKATCE